MKSQLAFVRMQRELDRGALTLRIPFGPWSHSMRAARVCQSSSPYPPCSGPVSSWISAQPHRQRDNSQSHLSGKSAPAAAASCCVPEVLSLAVTRVTCVFESGFGGPSACANIWLALPCGVASSLSHILTSSVSFPRAFGIPVPLL